jgi:hypothetical protein
MPSGLQAGCERRRSSDCACALLIDHEIDETCPSSCQLHVYGSSMRLEGVAQYSFADIEQKVILIEKAPDHDDSVSAPPPHPSVIGSVPSESFGSIQEVIRTISPYTHSSAESPMTKFRSLQPMISFAQKQVLSCSDDRL